MFLTGLSSTALAQDYIPILNEENTWSVDIYYEIFEPVPPNPCCYTVTEQLTLGETITINGVDYKQMFIDGTASCYLREENGFVYKYDMYDEVDRVLIDMNLQEGDVFNLVGSAYDSTSPSCNSIDGTLEYNTLNVDAVEFVEIAGATRKVITFNEWAIGTGVPIQWIEGIGNLAGFDSFWEFIDVTAGQALVCFTNNSGTYFFNDASSCDNTTLGVTDFSQDKIILYPNPVNTKSILQFPIEANIDLLKIYNISGKLVKEVNVPTNHFIVDMMQYPAGLYFYQVFSKERLMKTTQIVVE